jgi:hypothetical protein
MKVIIAEAKIYIRRDVLVREGRICWLNCGVLAEAAFHLGSSAYVLTLLEDEIVRIAFDCNRHRSRLKELALRYEDRNRILPTVPDSHE